MRELRRKLLFALGVLVAIGGVFTIAQQAVAKSPPPPWYPSVNADGDAVFAVFENRIPCADCERIKCALVLYRDAESKAPTSYLLARVFVGKNDDRIVSGGAWTIGHGTKRDPQAVVYQLDSNAPQDLRAFWAVDDDVLLVLNEDMRPRVGDASHGYALNRTR